MLNKEDKKMDLEESINNLKRLVELRKNKCGEIKFDTCICGTKDLEIVLQALKNSIPKKKIEEKYNFYKNKVEELRKSNINHCNATKYDYLYVGKKDAYEEMLNWR